MRRLALLLFLALPVFAAFGPERPVTGHDLVDVPDSRTHPRIASNGQDYLVVWIDERFGTYGLYATRVAADGTVLDPNGFYIAYAVDAEIVWTGRTYVAVWRGERSEMWTATISAEGVVGTPKVILPPGAVYYAVATNGSTVLVATNGGVGVLLDGDGTLIGELTLAEATNFNSRVAAASAGDEYLVAIGDNDGVITQRVSGSGQPSPAVMLEGSPRGAQVAIATDGTSYLVVSAAYTITAQLVSRENTRIGPVTTLDGKYTIEGTDFPAVNPRAVWSGSEYLVTWGRIGQMPLSAARVAPSGTPIGAPAKFADTTRGVNGEARLAASGGGRGAAAWVDASSLVKFAPLESLADAKAVSGSAAPQLEPALVNAGGRLITGWVELRPNGAELRIAPVSGAPIVTVAPIVYPRLCEIRLLFEGDTLWVVWGDDHMYARRYTPALEPIDAAPVAFDPAGEPGFNMPLAMAAGGDSVLVVFDYIDLFATALHVQGGTVEVTNIKLVAPDHTYHHAAAAWDGEKYVIAFAHSLNWPLEQLGEPVRNEILAVRLTRGGTLLDTTPIRISTLPLVGIDSVQATRGADGAIAIAWQTLGDPVHLARFTGTAQPEEVVLPWPTIYFGPVVAVPDGYVLFGHEYYSGNVQYQRVDLQLQPASQPEPLLAFPRATWWDPFYAVEATGAQLHIAYVRGAAGSEYGGVPRLFIRSTGDGAARRRAVR